MNAQAMMRKSPVSDPNSPLQAQLESTDRPMATELAQAIAGKSPAEALAIAAKHCRSVLSHRWESSQAQDSKNAGPVRRVHYLSMEFLMGRALSNALAALNMFEPIQAALEVQGENLSDTLESENDAALGNGGLGRLAACFLDSLAELGIPSFGYGLRYHYGMFAQRIEDGCQVEVPDDWMRNGNPWEVARPELQYRVGFGGQVHLDEGVHRWVPAENLIANAYDFIVPAHHGERVSTLRQWQASSDQTIDFKAFCEGNYLAAAKHKISAESINWVLYPDDSSDAGRILRLKQEAFLVSASLQDLIARHLLEFGSLKQLGKRNAIHLNDTHPALAPAELMRLLLDEHGMAWDEAWQITTQAVSYTNHTLMPEALETWPVHMFGELLPRHLEIIFEINRRFLFDVRQRYPGDDELVKRVSLFDEGGERRVRMAALAIVSSHKVNGVSALHSDLMVQTIFADYAKLFPERFHNVTNGVTPRRWLMQANPTLSCLIDKKIGTAWRQNLMQLSALKSKSADVAFGRQLMQTKRDNKQRLAEIILRDTGIEVNVDSLFDVQIKRIHEYKRQLLNILHVIGRYQAILADPQANWVPRTVIIAGKAASAYHAAKSIIQLAHDVAKTVNNDPVAAGRLKLVFLPNYSVSLAEAIIPAADLSEQISTAGTEASGTGNMKFSLNGALTIGTWDGANIEMAEAMGKENMFVFGLLTHEVEQLKLRGYKPGEYVEKNPALRNVLHALATGAFSKDEPQRYLSLVESLINRDQYLLMADYSNYVKTQFMVDGLYKTPALWAERVILNIAGMGEFSSDRTIRQYVDHVWLSPSSI
jgi:glycogen phosphorylase